MRLIHRFGSTLRGRILVFTGGVLLSLLLIISQVLLYQWREVIIAKQYDAAIAVTRTFSVTVIDAIIREDQAGGPRESILQTSMNDFMRSINNVKYVVVTDQEGQTRAASPSGAGMLVAHGPDRRLAGAQHVRIYNDPAYSWVIEVRLPLGVARKSWGVATIGFDATPIRDELRGLFVLLFVTTMMVSCATLIVLYFFASKLTTSLRKLVKEIDSVELGHAKVPALPQRGDDVAFLFDRFDLMKKRIDQSRLQLENAQRQVYQAEKLASIGRLASGVAHQVNNPLNGIRTCLYAITREPENLAQTREYIELIDEGITSIETVVQKLLGFARQQSSGVSLIDVTESTRKVVGLFDLRLKEKRIRVVLDLPDGLPPVSIDYHLFQEVVMNLLLNSYDAVAEGGEIAITARQDTPSTICLSVRDNGGGIAAEDLSRIFEPFFTTKEIGTGTGLGLSVCQSIVESHGGRITALAGEGGGAEFVVTLPIGAGHERTDY
jgi:two-component system, NtrC family, sensor kinase